MLTFFHIPLNFGAVMARNMEKIVKAGALAKEPLLLADDCSPFRTDVFIATGKDVPGAEMVRISGRFLSKAFEGPYTKMGSWVREMNGFVRSRGVEAKKLYFFYTTCPACAKHYGQSYTVILAQI